MGYGFQSTLPLRGATVLSVAVAAFQGISIHAPLTGSDMDYGIKPPYWKISIHAPLTGSDASLDCGVNSQGISIHAPLTGSDVFLPPFFPPFDYFNPRSPYGERPAVPGRYIDVSRFQSTLPLRGATITPTLLDLWQHISIHAPLTGSDLSESEQKRASGGISIHAPLTGSDIQIPLYCGQKLISIHAPLTGSDGPPGRRNHPQRISIHAPLTGSDPP